MEQQPSSLTEALSRLDRFDTLSVQIERADAEAAKFEKAISKIEGKAQWADREKAATMRELAKVYRDPAQALGKIKAEIDRVGIGRATAKLERQPEAFGKMYGWRVAGGILTKQPFTLFANAARREAKRHVSDLGREVRKNAGIERVLKAETAGKPELVQRRDNARAVAQDLREQRGEGYRWHRIRDVERAAKTAAPKERTALPPEARNLLERIEADQRNRFAKKNQDRSQPQGKTQKGQSHNQERGGPSKARDQAPEQGR